MDRKEWLNQNWHIHGRDHRFQRAPERKPLLGSKLWLDCGHTFHAQDEEQRRMLAAYLTANEACPLCAGDPRFEQAQAIWHEYTPTLNIRTNQPLPRPPLATGKPYSRWCNDVRHALNLIAKLERDGKNPEGVKILLNGLPLERAAEAAEAA